MMLSQSRPLSVGVGILVAGIGLTITFLLGVAESRRYRQDAEARVLEQLSTVRAAVERALNERIYLTLGLRALVSTNPDMGREQFARFAAALMLEGDGIRSVTLIKDNVISDVYPLDGNESAIGVRLLDHPQQRADVLRAIESRQAWLSSPVELVQGGEAFINRAPVYETPPGGLPGSGRYWGLVSILISKDVLLDDISREFPVGLQVAIRARSSANAESEYFFGDAAIESSQPLTLDVNLATGDWQVAGVPSQGWPRRAPAALVLQWLGTIASLGTGVLTCLLLQSNQNLSQARTVAERGVVELSRKNEDLEAFVRTASHDLRTPLRHVRIFSNLLSEEASSRLNAQDRDHLDRIEHAINRMMELLDALLRFARTGIEGIHPRFFPLQDAVETVILQLPEGHRQRVRFGELPEVYADRQLLTQVLQNLIENALKYNRRDLPEVHVDATTTVHDVTFRVSDNGIGMQRDQLQRIFEPGIRGVSPSDYTGSGFGLAICERIVKAHRGKIWVESTPDVGSTFFVTLPIPTATS